MNCFENFLMSLVFYLFMLCVTENLRIFAFEQYAVKDAKRPSPFNTKLHTL